MTQFFLRWLPDGVGTPYLISSKLPVLLAPSPRLVFAFTDTGSSSSAAVPQCHFHRHRF